MGEVTVKLQIPFPGYLGSLRDGALKDVAFWANAAREDRKSIRKAEERRDEKRASLDREDFGNTARALNDASAIAAQIPMVEDVDELTLEGTAQTLASLVEETARVCAKSLLGAMDIGPLPTEDIRPWMQELDWWLDAHDALLADDIALDGDGKVAV